MAKCLEVAFKANIPKPQRRRIVAKTADWTMLDKPWRSLVYIAMEELEPLVTMMTNHLCLDNIGEVEEEHAAVGHRPL